MNSACVVSDLHMFCRRSQWEQHLEAMHRGAADADLFVFNGDTVDFKWTSLAGVNETVDCAVNFLKDFAGRYPNTQIHVNLGNHDHVAPFITELDKLAHITPNLSWHPYYFRVNSTMFLHGDVANRRMSHAQLERYRAHWNHDRKESEVKNQIYDAAFRAGAHLAVSRLAFPHRRTIKRVAAYLEDIGQTGAHGIRRVYFGHTHVPVAGYTYRGITFHNGGAPMEGMGFQMLKTEL